MRIAVLGFGNVGAQLAKLWLAKGHSIVAGLREGSKDRDAALALRAEVADPTAAARAADVIVLALPWGAVEGVLQSIGSLAGKVVLDATNPLQADLSVVTPEAGSAGEQVAQWASGAKVVKAFNTIGAAQFGHSGFDMFYCGDDADAKELVRKLISETGMSPVDVGPLRNAGYLEQMAGLWIDLAMNGRVQGPFGFGLIRQ